MLNAFQNHLKELAHDTKDPFTSIIKKIVGPSEAPHFEKPVRDMVLAMPAMIRQVGAWSEEPAQPTETRRLHSFLLRYLYHSTDFLSEKNLGLFGYVDDAYIVSRVYARTLEEDDKVGLKPYVERAEIASEVRRWIETTRRLLPDETRKMDQLLSEFKHHADRGFFWAIDRAARGTPLSRKLEKEVLK